MDDVKEWVSVTHTAAGATSVKVVLSDGTRTARWAVKAFVGEKEMRAALAEARAGAERALTLMQELARG